MTAERTFDAFVFDLDGTLLDTLPDLVAVTNETMTRFGYPTHDTAAVLAMVGNGLRSLIVQALPDGLSDKRTDEAVAFWKAAYDRRNHTGTKVYDGMAETLDELHARGKKLAVLSNKFDAGVKHIMARFLPNVMDFELGEGPVPRKPDPAGLLLVAETLGVEPARIAFVGDTAETDMQAAHNAGAYGIGVSWGYQPARILAAKADVLIDHPSQLLDFA